MASLALERRGPFSEESLARTARVEFRRGAARRGFFFPFSLGGVRVCMVSFRLALAPRFGLQGGDALKV
jgi:hypothetical protein